MDSFSDRGVLPGWKQGTIRGKIAVHKLPTQDRNESYVGFSRICYKGDGSRFDIDTTIKFNVDANYELSLTFRPVVKIERMEIGGEVKAPSESSRDIESVTYVTGFDTKAKATSKKGKRDKINFNVDLGSYGLLNFDLQAKYYAEKDGHVDWGSPLHHIEFEANCNDGEVKISKMLFR